MRNPIRRNKNIGTAKQGYGQNNRLTIPQVSTQSLQFYERLGEYTKTYRDINGNRFEFVIEATREKVNHACTVDDLAEMIRHIPPADYGDLNLIILRQPKRKEENLALVWGRLIYYYEFEKSFRPAVIIEATDCERTLKWPKKLSVDDQKELDRLRKDGHQFVTTKRHFIANYDIENVRNTQLYRTLPHEFGHYIHYHNVVIKPLKKMKAELDKLDAEMPECNTTTKSWYKKWLKMLDEYTAQLEQNEAKYFAIIKDEKEVFAHTYADKLIQKLEACEAIPFDRIEKNIE